MKMVHVTITTAHFQEEVEFYENIAGLKIQRDMRPLRNMVFLADQAGDTCIEIIEDQNAENITHPYLSVGFHAGDVKAKHEELKAAGYEVSEMISPNPHVQFFFVRDPAGIRIQFI